MRWSEVCTALTARNSVTSEHARLRLVFFPFNCLIGIYASNEDCSHVHLGKGRYQGLLAALTAFEDLRGKSPVAILRNSKLELAYPGYQARV